MEDNREVEIPDNYNILAEDLLFRWGFEVEDNISLVKDISTITSELSAWGIPWKRTKWIY